jgi:acetylglutamate kinase
MKPSEALPKFLRSIGRSAEAQFYLELFRAEAKERFAAIAFESAIVREAPDAILLDLRFLNSLGLTPVVVLGLEDNQDTTAAQELYRRLQSAALKTVTFAGVQNTADIVAAVRGGVLPLVSLAGPDAGRRIAEVGQMLATLQTRKLIFLQDEGGLRRDGSLVSVVNLSNEFHGWMEYPALSERQKELVTWSNELIFSHVSHPFLVAITSPLDLLYELFTVKGAGTLLRRGAPITVYRGVERLDTGRLRGLLEASFGCPPVDGIFSRPLSRVYLEEGYLGTALVVDTALGGYLTKYAVTRQAQGEGIGHDLWQRVVEDYPTLFWRARPDNTIVPWYEKQCDGRVRVGSWIVYFKGLQVDSIGPAIRYALNQPIDFKRPSG